MNLVTKIGQATSWSFYMCFHGPNGCLVPSRPTEGETDISLQSEELEVKLNTLAKERSLEIESYLTDEKKTAQGLIKILLLGGPSCGKSTVFKQMQIIHKDGFKRPDQLEYFRELINRNIRDIFLQLLAGANILNISITSIQKLVDSIEASYHPIGTDEIKAMTRNRAELLSKFWLSEQIQKVFSQRYAFPLMDSTRYFLENIQRIGEKDYVPCEEDIVHSRHPTFSITSTNFIYNGLKMRLVDVGGQKSQRRKWLHLFDDVRVVLFVVDLTGYAKRDEEDRKENHMTSTMKIFKEIATNKVLRPAVLVLFLNKVDLYEELLTSVRFSDKFPDYKGPNNVEGTSTYIKDKFVQAAKPRKSVIPHFTTATNTENIKVVFRGCMESVFKANSRATGLT
ncbi:unnamed protein product [Caenorhabditis auriculariae]|uniref:Uncharacterized protein n=1 Tax=Caenorhabditis auriculariae TaxID=2777116 RepID=A0A8S1H0M5_9PELO|nr:unnamed protein product [Caenorhabditis auriculariae]